MMKILCLGDFKRTNIDICKPATLYHRELLRKRPSLCTFCTQLFTQSLMWQQTFLFRSSVKEYYAVFGLCYSDFENVSLWYDASRMINMKDFGQKQW